MDRRIRIILSTAILFGLAASMALADEDRGDVKALRSLTAELLSVQQASSAGALPSLYHAYLVRQIDEALGDLQPKLRESESGLARLLNDVRAHKTDAQHLQDDLSQLLQMEAQLGSNT